MNLFNFKQDSKTYFSGHHRTLIRLKYNIFEIIKYTFTFHDFKTELAAGRELNREGELNYFLFQERGA